MKAHQVLKLSRSSRTPEKDHFRICSLCSAHDGYGQQEIRQLSLTWNGVGGGLGTADDLSEELNPLKCGCLRL